MRLGLLTAGLLTHQYPFISEQHSIGLFAKDGSLEEKIRELHSTLDQKMDIDLYPDRFYFVIHISSLY